MAKHHWARNELILAPELCFREPFVTGSKTHPEVITFSTNCAEHKPDGYPQRAVASTEERDPAGFR